LGRAADRPIAGDDPEAKALLADKRVAARAADDERPDTLKAAPREARTS
jgi:hypothetical protein